MPELKIISGGQTGVDRAALDIAIELGIRCGGWCPKGRWAEDGEIPSGYPLTETGSVDPSERTKMNIADSDGTVVLHAGQLDSGTALTISVCALAGKPLLEIDLSERYNIGHILQWISQNHLREIHIAGPRESHSPGIYHAATHLLKPLLADLVQER